MTSRFLYFSRRSVPKNVMAAPVAVVPMQVGHVPQQAGAASIHRSRNGMTLSIQKRSIARSLAP
jgi:hypothetical protein